MFDEAQKRDIFYYVMKWIDKLAKETNYQYQFSWHRVLFITGVPNSKDLQGLLNAMTELFILLKECNCSISKFDYETDGLIRDLKNKRV